MARISNPRVFLFPSFIFREDGTFIEEKMRASPSDLFECSLESGSLAGQSPSNVTSESEIVFGPDQHFATLAASAGDTPIFWQAELIGPDNQICADASYLQLWETRKRANIAYVNFGDYMTPMRIKARGRLLDLALYFKLFEVENDKSAAALVNALSQQVTQEIVRKNWSALTTAYEIDLRNGRKLLSEQIAAHAEGVDLLLRCL